MRRGAVEEGLPLALPRSKENRSRLARGTVLHLFHTGPNPHIQPSLKHVPAPVAEVTEATISPSLLSDTLSQVMEMGLTL